MTQVYRSKCLLIPPRPQKAHVGCSVCSRCQLSFQVFPLRLPHLWSTLESLAWVTATSTQSRLKPPADVSVIMGCPREVASYIEWANANLWMILVIIFTSHKFFSSFSHGVRLVIMVVEVVVNIYRCMDRCLSLCQSVPVQSSAHLHALLS